MNHSEAKQALRRVVPLILDEVSVPAMFARHKTAIEDLARQIEASDNTNREPKLVAIGKMAEDMTYEFVRATPGLAWRGIVCSPYPAEKTHIGGLSYFRGGHPLPNEQSLQAATSALNLVKSSVDHDVVVFLISGGGSAAFELPDPAVDIRDLQTTYETLVNCGAGIGEINTVRTYLSRVKGGKLAVASFPARQITLAVSDVPTDNLGWIASGPTIYDNSTRAELATVIREYDLMAKVPDSVKDVLRSATMTPKKDWREFSRSDWHCIGSNYDALEATRQICEASGWSCEIDTSCDESSAHDAARTLIRKLESCGQHGLNCLIGGGEVRTVVRGSGTGGRNQEFVLECIPLIAGKNMAVISFGTDGIDGNSDAAGAVAAGDSLERCAGLDISTIRQESNSNQLFHRLDDLIVTGPTGTNVRDVRMLLKWQEC